jgi:hypothetical protein
MPNALPTPSSIVAFSRAANSRRARGCVRAVVNKRINVTMRRPAIVTAQANR